jgi:hypothetical protein
MRRHDTYSPQFWFVLSFALMTRLARMVVSEECGDSIPIAANEHS